MEDVDEGCQVDITEAAIVDQGGRDDFTQAATEVLGEESDVLSILLSTIPSHDSSLLSTAPSDILHTDPSRVSTAKNWSDIDKDKPLRYAGSSYAMAWDEVDKKYVQPAVQRTSDAPLVVKEYSRYCYIADDLSYRAHPIRESSSGEVFVPAHQADIILDRTFMQPFQDLSLRDSLGREVDEMAQKEVEHKDLEVKEDVKFESSD